MKYKLRYLLIAVAVVVAGSFYSCDDDDFTATIFDTTDYPLDRSVYTFPLDTFLKANFLEPYNVRFNYKFDDKGSDMNKNLTPAAYDKSVDLAVLTKYLWYDIYKDIAGVEFLKENSPRVISVTGSKNYNASQGTETLGDASSGVKINLYNVNNLNVNDIDLMNEYFFKTMHHEFAHILDQTHIRPTAFNLISRSHYDAANWQHTPDSISAGLGFTSPYASSAVAEDWAETLANYLTRDSLKWQTWLSSAQYDWEQVDIESSSAYADSVAAFNGRKTSGNSAKDSIFAVLRAHGVTAYDQVGYFYEVNSNEYKVYRRVAARNADNTIALGEDGKIQYTKESGLDGRATILQKVQMMREYLQTYYSIDIDQLRYAVQSHEYVTNSDGSFATTTDATGQPHLINKLTSNVDGGGILMDSLRNWVYQYNSLITK